MKHTLRFRYDFLICFSLFFLITVFTAPSWASDQISILGGEVPLINGAEIVKETLHEGFGQCELTVAASPGEVARFYNQAMQARGWPAGRVLSGPNLSAFMLKNQGDQFALKAEAKNGRTLVTIAFIRVPRPTNGQTTSSNTSTSIQSQSSESISAKATKTEVPQKAGVRRDTTSGSSLSGNTQEQLPAFPLNTPVADQRLAMFLPTVQDGRSLDLDKPLIIHFTQPVNPVFFSFEVTPEKGKWTPQWSADFKQVVLVPDYLPEPDQAINLMARITGGPSVEKVLVFKKLSPERQLAHDLKAGHININQASRYRLFSLFKPSQVPEQYRSTHPGSSGTPLLKKVRKDFDQLDEATRKELEPYFLNPGNPESYWYAILHQKPSISQFFSPFKFISEAWAAVPTLVEELYITENGYILVIQGMPGEADVVRRVHYLLKTEKMYKRFKDFLDRDVPTPENNKRIFIYIIPKWILDDEDEEYEEDQEETPSTAGQFFQADDTNEPVILISAYSCQEENELGGTVAHELFHAFQTAYQSYSAPWLEESTAVWAENYINKEWNSEQIHIEEAFEEYFGRTAPLDPDSDDGAYGFYIFPYYLSTVQPKQESLIREIWEKRGYGMSEIDALTSVLGDDLNDIWKGYSLSTLDVEPKHKSMPDIVGKRFGGTDPLIFSDKHGWSTLFISSDSGDTCMVGLAGLQTAYFDVYNTTSGPGAPAIRFNLEPFEKYQDRLSVQAVIHYKDGREEYEDWTGKSERLFCLDKKSDDFAIIYIAIGCSDSDLIFLEPLAITHDLSSRCHSGTVTLTRSFEEREQLESTSCITTNVTKTQSRQSSGNRSVTLRLDLDFNERILPEQRDALDQMEARAKMAEPDQVKAVRGFMEKIIKTPQVRYDEKTGLVKVRYRIKTCSIDSGGGNYRSHSQGEDKDVYGISSQWETNFTRKWSATGLARDTRKNIERGHIRAEILYEPETGKIQWVRVPQLDVDLHVEENSSGYYIRRSKDGYETTSKSGSDSKDETLNMTYSSGGKAAKGLPMDPVWQAKQSNAFTASGGARVEKPVNTEFSEEGRTGVHKKMMVESFEWSINLSDEP